MKVLRFALRFLWREARGGELAVLLAALSVAVGSVTAIGFLTDRVGQAVAAQAAEVLAADIRIRATDPLDPATLVLATEAGLRSAETTRFPSVIYLGDESALATIKAVSENYPLRGRVRVTDKLLGSERPIDEIPAPGTVWPDTALLARLGGSVGDHLNVGDTRLVVTKVLTYRPDQSAGFTSLAPSLLANVADLDASALIGPGSRVSYAQLFAGSPADVGQFRGTLDEILPDTVRIEDQGEAGEQLTRAIERASRFLALASLVSLLLAAVAVAMSARRYAERRLDSAALMKSLGATQGFVLSVNAIQLFVVALLASVIGSALGFAAERALVWILADLIQADLPQPSLQPVLLGFGTATILLLGFALPALLRLRATPPLRVLRHDLEPPPIGLWLGYGASLLALSLMVYWSVRDLSLVVIVMGGTALTAVALYLAGRALIAGLSRFRGRVGVSWRYGLANVARRGSMSAVQVVAFGLGLMVLLFLTLVRNDLMAGWRSTIAEGAPNQFLINIQPAEVASVRELFTEEEIPVTEFVPLVRARLIRINDVDVRELDFPTDRGPGFVRREANLSFTETLSGSNEIVAGEWWPAGYAGAPLVSVDEEVATDLGLKLGDVLTFNVAGVELNAPIESLRSIEWDSFQPNFFMVLSPGALDDYPKTFISSLYVAPEKRASLLRLVRKHPSISVIDLGAVIAQIRSVIDRASGAVQAVFLFTLAAGLVVLFAAVQATLDERRYESALLRTFGATTGTVFAGIAAEFLALGSAAGIFAALGATLLGWVVASSLFDLPYTADPALWVAGIVAGTTLVGASGLLAARSAVNSPPVKTLRHTG